MKNANHLMVVSFLAGLSMLFSCSNESEEENVLNSETVEVATEMAVTESAENELFASVSDAVYLAEREESNEKSGNAESSCATISVKPITNRYPKTITVDYGDGCTSTRGISRSGKIVIVISDSLHAADVEVEVAFDEFKVQGFIITGTLSFVNNGTSAVPSFYQQMELAMTNANGVTVQKTKTATRKWIEGVSTTDILSDDVFEVTSNAEVTSSNGWSYDYTVTEPLEIALNCEFIRKGVVEINVSTMEEPIVVDFGGGTCDKRINISQGKDSGEEVIDLEE